MAKRLDIVLFGATGFTGQDCIPWIAKLSKTKNRNLTWGVSGRSEEKLRTILDFYEDESGCSLRNIPTIIADVQDEDSLHSMARQARVIINCCGPFRLLGEAVIRACLEERAHYVDVSAEVQFIEEMQLKYHKQAEERGVHIISACGFESIPIDLGVVRLQEEFNGTLNSVEAYAKYWEEETVEGPAVNFTSWKSVLLLLAQTEELKLIRQQLFENELPSFRPKLKTRLFPYKSGLVDGWVVPFNFADGPVVERTQRLLYEKESKRPVQIKTYFTLNSFLYWILATITNLLLPIIVKFAACLNLLLKYPEIFTFGLTSHQPPNVERHRKSRFSITLCGNGWKEKFPSPDYQFPGAPDRMIAAKIQGSNSVYGATSLCIVLSAIIVLTESDRMPSKGVLPPGYAFAKTSLLQQIDENGVKFEILYERDSK